MGRLAIVVAALLLVGATACGERSEPTGATVPLYPVTVQVGDRPLVVEGPAKRLAVVSAPLSVIAPATPGL